MKLLIGTLPVGPGNLEPPSLANEGHWGIFHPGAPDPVTPACGHATTPAWVWTVGKAKDITCPKCKQIYLASIGSSRPGNRAGVGLTCSDASEEDA